MRYKQLLFLIIAPLLITQCANAQSEMSDGVITVHNHPNNPYYSHTDTTELDVLKSEWKKILPENVYHIAFERGTQRAFSGKYWDYEGKGTYYCGVCGNKLFRSTAKFASMCGWPSFFEPSREGAVVYKEDHRYGMNRMEVICGRCGAHLGHVFKDGPPPTGLRYCINSVVLDFVPDGDMTATK